MQLWTLTVMIRDINDNDESFLIPINYMFWTLVSMADWVINKQAVNIKKNMTLMSSKLEPTLWSCDTGQQMPLFDSCQLTMKRILNVKLQRCKLHVHA